MTRPAASLRTLLDGLIDYAGLFPPAALDMGAAAAEYAAQRASAHAWALGRFVCPAARLAELAEVAAVQGAPWPVAALVGADVQADCDAIVRLRETHGERFVVDVVEGRAADPEAIEAFSDALPDLVEGYVEIPIADDPAALLDVAADHLLSAKIRTGGLTPDAFPPAAQIARFMVRCAERGLSFKATAGLHHPLRGEYRLTYVDAAPHGTMYGFLNVFMAAALAYDGGDDAMLVRVLEEREPRAFIVRDDAIGWADPAWPSGFRDPEGRPVLNVRAVRREQLAAMRTDFARAFGSCSFAEPIADLHALSLL